MKRFLLLLTAIAMIATNSLRAQLDTWRVYPSYYIATKNIVADDIIYSLTDGNLMTYNIKDTEVRTYDILHGLNGVKIKFMEYSKEAKKLILVYADNSIDLLDADDNVQNITALRDKAISGKDIIDLYVNGSMAYITTGFGFVELNAKEGILENTYRLDKTLASTAASDDKVFIATTTGVFSCDKDKDMHIDANWKKLTSHTDAKKLLLFEDKLIVKMPATFRVVDTTTGSMQNLDSGTYNIFKVDNDQFVFSTTDRITFIKNLPELETIKLNNAWKDITYHSGIYWVSDGANGLCGYKLQDGEFTMVTGPIQPNSPKHDMAYRMNWVGNRLLVAGGINTLAAIYNDPTAMYYEDGKWTILPDWKAPAEYTSIRVANVTDMAQDPSDPEHIYASLHRNGLLEYKAGKLVNVWNHENSPIRPILPLSSKKYNYVSCAGLNYDTEGNLWMLNSMTDTIVRVLKKNGKWASLYYDEIASISLSDNILHHSSGLKVLNSRCNDERGFFFFDTRGTLDKVSDDRHKLFSSIINQDDTEYDPFNFYGMCEDLEGCIWLGTDLGLFVVQDPSKVFDNDFRFTQVKINRNDGSGLADYLLSGIAINCIAVDGANRKWIGTETNGIYLISADGQEMIHHFTAADSPLLSDNVQCIAINHETGEVMIGTEMGICSYSSDATNPAEDLNKSNVEVFPNPVRSDYTGPIAIKGLTLDSEVKIITTSGQLVWSGNSNGGMLTWNGCNGAGKRVASGVYHVIANDEDGKKAIVTRIVVIN